MSSFPASSADNFSGEFAVDSDLSIDHGSTVPEAQGFKDPNPSYSQPSFEPIHVENENENDNKNGDFPVDHASTMPETYRSAGLNPSFSQSSYELIHVENENDKGYGGFGENDISGDDVFVSDSMVLPLPTEMKSKEFFTLQEWRRMVEVVTMLRKESEMLEQENLRCPLLEKEVDCLEQDVDIKDLKEPIVSLSGFVRLQIQKA